VIHFVREDTESCPPRSCTSICYGGNVSCATSAGASPPHRKSTAPQIGYSPVQGKIMNVRKCLTLGRAAITCVLAFALSAQSPFSDQEKFQRFVDWLSSRQPTSRPRDFSDAISAATNQRGPFGARCRSGSGETVATSVQRSRRVTNPVEQTLRRRDSSDFHITANRAFDANS
jgi:hypothetical protein